jgi:DNA modification methylase
MDIKLNSSNPRSIDKEKFKKLCNSVKQFPKMIELRPIIVDKNGVILGGNMRFRALQENKMDIKPEWIKTADSLTPEERRRFIVEDNLEFGAWDFDELSTQYEVDELLEWGFDEKDLKIETEVIEDEAPEVSQEPAISKLGEVYQLGRHRVMCGDSTKIEGVKKLMDGKKADEVITDPPYNTGMKEKTGVPASIWLKHMFNDGLTQEQFNTLITDSLANMLVMTKGDAVFYVFIDWRNVGFIKDKLSELMGVHNVIVWDKKVHGLGSDYKFTYEMCVVGKKGKPKIENRMGLDYQDIWRVQRTMGRNEDHATAKPIELLVKPINHASKQDDIILDLFLGSGSTLIACEQTNRICYGCEIDPKYVDVIRKRYAKFIGKETEWEAVTPKIN